MDREHRHLLEKVDQLQELAYRKDQALEELTSGVLQA